MSEIKVGAILPGVCCEGHVWEIIDIVETLDDQRDAVWGVCSNPDCPRANESSPAPWQWDGIQSYDRTDLERRVETIKEYVTKFGITEEQKQIALALLCALSGAEPDEPCIVAGPQREPDIVFGDEFEESGDSEKDNRLWLLGPNLGERPDEMKGAYNEAIQPS